jgi:chemotaxis response regulator CheB
MVITGFTKEELKATLIGGLAGGLSALKTIIIELKEG